MRSIVFGQLLWNRLIMLPSSFMDPYARPDERKVGARRPKISHLPSETDPRTRAERKAEKEHVVAERRAIKKSARRHLQKELQSDLEEAD